MRTSLSCAASCSVFQRLEGIGTVNNVMQSVSDKEKTIHIAMALNNSFTELTCVSMASVLANTKWGCCFHVLFNSLTDENQKLLSSLCERFSHGTWKFYHVDNIYNEKLILDEGMRLSTEAYYRLFLSDVLEDIDKVLYLDCDTIAEDDLSKIWNIDLCGQLAAVAKRASTQHVGIRDRKQILGLDIESNYFNSGVILFNLAKIREEDVFANVYEVISLVFNKFADKLDRFPWAADQDVLNYLLKNRTINISPKYNHISVAYNLIDNDEASLEEWAECYKSPCIRHFVGIDKPTIIKRNVLKSSLDWERFYYYKSLTPISNVAEDDARIARYNKYLDNWRNGHIENRNTYFYYNQIPALIDLASQITSIIVEKKLAIWGLSASLRTLMALLAGNGVYPALIVDGLEKNHGVAIFGDSRFVVQSSKCLEGKASEYIVLLAMQDEQSVRDVSEILTSYGYSLSSIVPIYRAIYDSLREEILP